MKMKMNMLERDPNLQNDEINHAVKSCMQEYKLNMNGVKEVLKSFVFEISSDLIKEQAEANIERMIKLRYSKQAPKIIVQGPPGSGKST